MSAGFKIWNVLHNEQLSAHPHVAGAVLAASTLAVAGVAYRALSPKGVLAKVNDEAFVPKPNLGVSNVLDMLGSFVQGLCKDIIGHHYAAYLPLLSFVFIWTLVNNLLGLFPGFGGATDNINSTLAMGAFIFLYYNFMGFKTHGISYLLHFMGHLHGVLLLVMGPVMFFIEVISHMIRPVTLGIRLRTNISVDHFVFQIFTGLLKDFGNFLAVKLGAVGEVLSFLVQALGPIPIVILGILVCVIQAFVFTLLSAIYIGMATAHEEH